MLWICSSPLSYPRISQLINNPRYVICFFMVAEFEGGNLLFSDQVMKC